ncbi:MAG: UDP-N-acetylglucosamine 1-carboxyvinyltransferase [Parcubacteria group bacterium]|nr:UDP-N-acetylglucosamine 1-carboxyvinyltransferase [Parcubacteria group bacterium]
MAESFQINGGKQLSGTIAIGGAKNHALKMFPASLLSTEPCTLTRVPDIVDVAVMGDIIRAMGGTVKRDGSTYTIDTAGVRDGKMPADLVVKMRASFLFLVPLLHRFGEVHFPHPGGDAIGQRPIDMTLDFLQAMGVTVEEQPYAYIMRAKKLKGVDFTFKWISHTGTEAMVMAAVLAEGRSVIKNAAMEPEVVALCEYLNSVGAKITGQGTPTITVDGVAKLSGGACTIIPDRIDAGTFAILGALCGNDLRIEGLEASHLDALWKMFDLIGVPYTLEPTAITVSRGTKLLAQHVKTHEYPGLATDLQPPMTLLLTQCQGLSLMHETVYEGRLFFIDQLNKMGGKIIMADPHRVFIDGPCSFYGQSISSPDLRAGFTYVMAALIAKGKSTIANIHHIDRGYEALEKRLQDVGADIVRVAH